MGQISLKAARVNAGYNLDDVAEAIGKTAKTLSNWERGITAIPTHEFNRLSELYKMGTDFIKVPIVDDGEFNG